MGIKILKGDCLETLKSLDEQSINTCVTSPPYWGLRDYGVDGQLGLEDSPDKFVENLVEVFREVKRVLRDDGTVWLNLGDSYARTGGDSSKKGRHWDNRENNPNTGHNRYAKDIGLKQKDLVGIPWRVAFALQADGWYLRQDIIWHKPNPMPESVRDRCTKAHEYIFLLSKNPKYYYDNEAIKEDAKSAGKKSDGFKGRQGGAEYHATSGGIGSEEKIYNKKNKRSVWTITTKPYKEAHFATFPTDLIEPCVLAGCPEKVCVQCSEPYKLKVDIKRIPRWELSPNDPRYRPSKYENAHDSLNGNTRHSVTETKPLGLEKQCDCQTNETKGGTVLDPFGGSGTTGVVAIKHNRNAVLCELNEGYIDLAEKRLNDGFDIFSSDGLEII
jgi:DNA modification methylase